MPIGVVTGGCLNTKHMDSSPLLNKLISSSDHRIDKHWNFYLKAVSMTDMKKYKIMHNVWKPDTNLHFLEKIHRKSKKICILLAH